MRYGKGENVVPEETWERRVVEDHAVWSEFGCPIDIRSNLPAREYKAHLAIIEGKAERREKNRQKAEKESNKVNT